MLHPVRVGLALKVARVGFLEEDFQNGFSVQPAELDVMVVVAQDLARGTQDFAGGIEAGGERLHFGKGVELDAGRPGVSSEVATEFLEVLDDLLRFVEDHVAVLVRCATVEALAFEHGEQLFVPDGAEPAELHGFVADGADFFQCLRDFRRRFGEITNSVLLGGNLIDFHRL
jgi:hypothetical protein